MCVHTPAHAVWMQSYISSTGFPLSALKAAFHVFFLSPSCGCLLVKWRFHHLTGTLYSVWPKPLTAHCDDRWQRGPLCFSDHPKPRTTECHLKQALVLQSVIQRGSAAVSGKLWVDVQGRAPAEVTETDTALAVVQHRAQTHTILCMRVIADRLFGSPPGERASKLFCVKGMRSSWGIPWGDRVRGST